jgi:hypothetical protein
VARYFQQEHDHNYNETFAHVAHMTIVRTLVVASVCNWSISELDVKNAFLNGELQGWPGLYDQQVNNAGFVIEKN